MSTPQPFNPKLVIGLIVAGTLAFGAMLLLIAYGGNIGSSRDGRAHALSVSAVGFKGLVTLAGAFHPTRLLRDADDRDAENLVVVALEENSRPEDLAELLGQRRGRATLIVLPKWLTRPDPARRGWVQAIAPVAGAAAEEALGGTVEVSIRGGGAPPAFAQGEDMWNGLRLPVPRSPQTVAGKGVTPLVRLPGGGALVARLGDQPHYLLADPDLLNNHGLGNPDNASAALALIETLNATGASAVDFDLSMNGIGAASSPSMLRLAFEPPFLVMTLALFAAAVLAGLHGAFRFGPTRAPERAIAFGKAALVENSAGLIRQADREAHLGAAYADVVRYEAARTTAAPHWLQGDSLDRYLDRLSRPGQPRFSELAARLAEARDRHRLMAAARALSEWKRGIIR